MSTKILDKGPYKVQRVESSIRIQDKNNKLVFYIYSGRSHGGEASIIKYEDARFIAETLCNVMNRTVP